MSSLALPRDNIIRAIQPGLEVRAAEGDGMPTLVSRFSVFDVFTEIDSWFEGRFLEKIARGAFRKTFKENRSQIKVLFNHGHDPSIGSKILGPSDVLREEPDGAYGESPLFDTSYNRDLLPGIETGQYGASFRFQVVKEKIDQEPERSDHNPEGLPERTITEIRLHEWGPVTFPAYPDATSGVRSLTDELLIGRLLDDPTRLEKLVEASKSRGIIVPKDVEREDPDPEDTVEEIDEEIEPADTEAQTEQEDEALEETEPVVETTPETPSRDFDFWFVGAGDDPTPPRKRRRERLLRLTEQS